MDIHELARQNQQSAWKVLEDTRIIEAWERIGATVHLVGSLRTGLLAKSRDIDIHIYTDRLDVGESFSVIRELAERLPLQEIQYRNLIHTEEECMEWHALYKDREQNTWKFDMIHIQKGSSVGSGTTAPKMRVGAKVKYSGPLYRDSNGGGQGKTVNGPYTVKYYYPGRKCGVHIDGLGWVPESGCTVIG